MRSRSRHSRRAEPTKRSATEFALGARTGVFTIRMPSARNTSSKPTVNFVSRSRMRNLTGRERSASTKLRLRACWVTHRPVGLAVTANKALRDRIRSRGSYRSLHYPDAVGAEHVVEADGELRVPVADEELDRDTKF